MLIDDNETLEKVMGIIIYAGNAKSEAFEAIEAAKNRDFELANEKLIAAEESFVKAHKSQSQLLTLEAQGNKIEVSLLIIHSQDHLMTSMTFVDLAKEIISLRQEILSQ